MIQLNYFKPIEQLSEDFKKLSIGKQNIELTGLLNRYIEFVREDYKIIGQKTQRTKNIWNVYEHLKDVRLKKIEELMGNTPT